MTGGPDDWGELTTNTKLVPWLVRLCPTRLCNGGSIMTRAEDGKLQSHLEWSNVPNTCTYAYLEHLCARV